MEENIDSRKDTESNEEEALEEASLVMNGEKTKSNIIKSKFTENNLDINKQKITQEVNNGTKNEKPVADSQNDLKIKPKKEIPIEKKPFNEFVNLYLLPSLILEFKKRGFEVEDISLKKTKRPIAGDICWVIYCEIKDNFKFWLSFEKEDISSLKSISLCRDSQKPSIIESFLIDEKRITLKLIISRILQRLIGQKLIGIN